MRRSLPLLCVSLAALWAQCVQAGITVTPGLTVVPCFDIYEIVVQLNPPPDGNPFTDIEVSATFTPRGGSPIRVDGFCDDQEGRCFRVRFCPSLVETEYEYSLRTSAAPDE